MPPEIERGFPVWKEGRCEGENDTIRLALWILPRGNHVVAGALH